MAAIQELIIDIKITKDLSFFNGTKKLKFAEFNNVIRYYELSGDLADLIFFRSPFSGLLYGASCDPVNSDQPDYIEESKITKAQIVWGLEKLQSGETDLTHIEVNGEFFLVPFSPFVVNSEKEISK